ncbi:aminotransferase class V-fold PLP-dependent enzyme [Pelagerythrobacter rhizovicinus]|uniref:Cysteine desulfurase n=2 Tax=Pelagerythrobacter rhizovicinus TaxID=2268576 RepID=A0A4Q2KMR7_9SPHN|nr:aminotransferase class V-fold PLP-dependent enzyme [Pelagerythrobacter rhizovicinus]RXZ65757.1 aminotransferase class V-fold PLP-dependent enzyme [Pelagerythrobacter rhizovicinus]
MWVPRRTGWRARSRGVYSAAPRNRNSFEHVAISKRIYLDHAATTPLRPEAQAAMEEGFAVWANPSSPHAEGRKAKAALEDARARVKAALGWQGEVIFTSGASEALAIALSRAKADRPIVSAVEHDAVFRAARHAEVLPLVEGEADRDALDAALALPGRPIVAVQQVNPETGTLVLPEDGGALRSRVHEAGGLLLSDCSQSAGKLALPDADMAVVSAHKLGGPIGIGALLVRDFAMLEPVGGHERGYRAGTENLPAILGFAAALETGGLDGWTTTGAQRHSFAATLADRRVTPGAGQCAHILALTHPTLSAQALLIRLDAMGFAVSAGSACSSGTLKRSRVLEAFGVDEGSAARTIRISLGWSTTAGELDRFADAWAGLASA